MTILARICLFLAATFSLAAPCAAETFMIPKDGERPALAVDKPTGWVENYDQYGNLLIFSPDRSGFILFRMAAADPGTAMPTDPQMAEVILKSAGAQPYSKVEQTTFLGGAASDFISTINIANGPTFNLHVVLRRVDATHVAVGARATIDGASPAQLAAYDAAWRAVTVAR